MDDATLTSLEAALAASPSNADLRAVLVGALVDRGDAAGAARLVREVGAASFVRPHHRRAAARALLSARAPPPRGARAPPAPPPPRGGPPPPGAPGGGGRPRATRPRR